MVVMVEVGAAVLWQRRHGVLDHCHGSPHLRVAARDAAAGLDPLRDVVLQPADAALREAQGAGEFTAPDQGVSPQVRFGCSIEDADPRLPAEELEEIMR